MCSKVTVKHIWWIQRWKWRRRRREVEKLRVGFPRWNPLSQFAIYKQHHACIRRSRKGSKYKVQWFYLVGGEGILTIDFLILTRVVGFSPTFPKRGSNLVSATIYIFFNRERTFSTFPAAATIFQTEHYRLCSDKQHFSSNNYRGV